MEGTTIEETKHLISNPSKPRISLKEIPRLDPSSIPGASFAKPRSRMVPDYEAKYRCEEKSEVERREKEEVEEDAATSNIQIDPNSTPEKKCVPPHEADILPKATPKIHQEITMRNDGKRGSASASARSELHELCVARHWKPPVYECCSDQGPSHMKMYTFRVVVEIEEKSLRRTYVLESYGSPQSNKKIAAENAAQAALWYLNGIKCCVD